MIPKIFFIFNIKLLTKLLPMKSLTSIISLIFIFQFTYGQLPCSSTIYSYPRDWSINFKVAPTTDGGSILGGSKRNSNNNHLDAHLMKIDLFGNLMWEQSYGDSLDESTNAVHQTSDGGYIVIGTKEIEDGWPGVTRISLFKTNNNGLLEWEREIGPEEEYNYTGEDIKILPNGDFLIVGTESGHSLTTGERVSKMMIQRWDNTGNLIQTLYFNSTHFNPFDGFDVDGITLGVSVNLMNDGGYIFTGITGSPFGYLPLDKDAFVVKTDANLNIEWENIFTDNTFGSYQSFFMNMVELDGFYYGIIKMNFTGLDGGPHGRLIKIDLNGNEVWHHSIYGNASPRRLIVTKDNQLAAAFSNTLMKIDTSGTVIWQTDNFSRVNISNKNSLYLNSDNGFTVSGSKNNLQATNEIILIMVDSLGNTCNNYIEGRVFWDDDDNCSLDSTEMILPDLMVKVEPGPIYQLADSEGFYKIPVDSGTFTVTVSGLNALWEQTCATSYQVSFDTIYQTEDSLDFAFNTLYDCHLMNITANILGSRVCVDNFICLPYCNDGTADAEEVTIDLILDDNVSITASPIPYTQVGNQYTFEVGDVVAGECKTLYLNSFVACDAMLGDSLCIEASILPAEDCGSLISNNTITKCREITNSYDPNDKQATVDQREDCITEDTELIDYLIRFQNTGNDIAYRVVITDQISEKLDITSIQTIGNSHDFEWEIWNNNTIIWTFNNINLVDSSTNQLASQGFVQFKIAPKTAIDINSKIENEANIYFDYNDPILTNNLILEHCDFTPFQSMVVDSYNPTDCDLMDGLISIQVEASVNVEYSIDNGESWQSQNEFSDLAPGDYHVLIKDESGEYIFEYENNPIVIVAQIPPQINDLQIVDPSDLSSTDGTITIIAEGNELLVYSIDNGLTWQNSNIFEGLSIGNYQILIQYENETCQIISNEIILMGVVAITNLTLAPEVRINPNPARDNIFLTIKSALNKQLHISILNSNGKKVFTESLGSQSNVEKSIDISSFSSGLYFVSIRYGTEFFYEKLMVY